MVRPDTEAGAVAIAHGPARVFDNAALRIAVKHDETAMVFEYKLTGTEHTVGGFAASAFLVSKHNNLVASLLGGLPDVKEWYVHKVGCW